MKWIYHKREAILTQKKSSLDSEIFPRSLGYTSFRRDRASGIKGGGVFILVKDTLVASRQKTLETDCEVI